MYGGAQSRNGWFESLRYKPKGRGFFPDGVIGILYWHNPSYFSKVLVSTQPLIEVSKKVKRKGKAVPLQAWSSPEGSRKLRFPDFMTTAQDGGKVVSLKHRPPLPQEIDLVLIYVRGCVDPRAVVRPEGLCHWKIPMTRDLPICSVVP
jgi:hypothetical protein